METTQQLEEKLKEKLGSLAPKLSMESEKSGFLEIIDTCVSLLVQDLDSTCEPLLASLTKVCKENYDCSNFVKLMLFCRLHGNPLIRLGIKVNTFQKLLLSGN